VDTPQPPELDDDELRRIVAEAWAVAVDAVAYVPEGAGSYHWTGYAGGEPTCFLTVDDLDTKPWIGERRDAAFAGLEVAYLAARTIEHDMAAPFVVGPLEHRSGSVIRRLSDRFSLAVFPFVEGTPGTWGDLLVPLVRDSLIGHLAHLHGVEHGRLGLSRLPYEIPERPILEKALDDCDRSWEASAGPYAEPARQTLRTHGDALAARLTEMDDLAADLRQADLDPVVTHGEPHPGNVILHDASVRLIDWDTISLSRPERDLWMLDDGSPACLRRYETLTGRTVVPEATRFYRLLWTLSDIASLTEILRAPHEETPVTGLQFAAYERLLAGGTSEPYGH
jgi:spectinomycin phosphotransferase